MSALRSKEHGHPSFAVRMVSLRAAAGVVLLVAVIAGSLSAYSLLTRRRDLLELSRRVSALSRDVEQSRTPDTRYVFVPPDVSNGGDKQRKDDGGRLGRPAGSIGNQVGIDGRKEAAREQRRMFEQRIAAHWAEPTDGGWSERSRTSLAVNLETLAKDGKFRLADIDCRDTSCVATTEWRSRDDAISGMRPLVETRYAVNCARSFLIPDASDPGQSVQVALYFDCARWKASGSNMLGTLANANSR
jgi:hypothetical protein